MLQVGGRLDLVQEPVGADDGRQVRLQHLEGDAAVMTLVVSEVDGGHAAHTELALDAIAARQGRREMLSPGCHRQKMGSPSRDREGPARAVGRPALR